MALRFDAFYQGVPLLRSEYRRSDGLQPEFGTAEALTSQLPAFNIKFRAVEWPAGLVNAASGVSIGQWYRDFGRRTIAEESDPLGDLKAPKILEPFGDLVMRTYDEKAKVAEQVYQRVFIAPQGFREISEGLADPRAHKDGRVQFTLTDVRHYYRDHGPCIARINVKLRSGRWDPLSVQPSGQPWPAKIAVPYLFSQLPGSPRVHSDSALYKLGALCPELILEGEPAVQAAQKVLDSLGLVAKLQPDGRSYVVGRSVDPKIDQTKLYAGPGVEQKPVSRTWQEEKRAVWSTGRPPAVQVIGKRQVRRITLSCVPIFQDTDGRYYRLSDVEKRWGYKLSQMNKQATAGSEKQYQDMVPSPFGGGGAATLHWQRREIARKWFYRGYAPSIFFDVKDSVSGAGGVPSLADTDFERFPYLPMMDAPFYLSEISTISTKAAVDAKRGDRSLYALLPPVVRGRQVAEAFFGEWKEAEKWFRGVLANVKIGTDYFEAQIGQQMSVIAEALEEINRQSRALKDVPATKTPGSTIQLEADVKVLGASYGIAVDTQILRDTQANEFSNREARIIARAQLEIKKLTELLEAEKKKSAEWSKQLDAAAEAFNHGVGLPFWSTLPHQVVNGGYSLDPDTGVILFGDLTCTLDRAFAYSLEDAQVASDGHVLVTFGYELKKGNANDFTSVLFVAEDTDDDPAVLIAGVNRSSAIHAKVERAPEMRMYSTELGTPMNLGACVEEALALAQAQLTSPRIVTGHDVRYVGLQRCALVDGINSVQHVLQSDGRGHTTVVFNDPHAGAPLGPPNLPQGSATTGQIDARAQIGGTV